MEEQPSRDQLRAEMRRRIHERRWGEQALHRVSFWGRTHRDAVTGNPGFGGVTEYGQVMPQLIGVTDYGLDASGVWLLTSQHGTDQTVMTRIPEHVERITIDREESAA